jgi:hypothetical protein
VLLPLLTLTPPPLTRRFNLTLGERLIEHLKNWLDPDTMLQQGPFAWKSGGNDPRRGLGGGASAYVLARLVSGGRGS